MSGINSVKNYKYSILVKKKIGVLKRLKKRRKKVCWHWQLYILLKDHIFTPKKNFCIMNKIKLV